MVVVAVVAYYYYNSPLAASLPPPIWCVAAIAHRSQCSTTQPAGAQRACRRPCRWIEKGGYIGKGALGHDENIRTRHGFPDSSQIRHIHRQVVPLFFKTRKGFRVLVPLRVDCDVHVVLPIVLRCVPFNEMQIVIVWKVAIRVAAWTDTAPPNVHRNIKSSSASIVPPFSLSSKRIPRIMCEFREYLLTPRFGKQRTVVKAVKIRSKHGRVRLPLVGASTHAQRSVQTQFPNQV